MNKQTVENQLNIVKLVKNAPKLLSKEQKDLLKSFTGWGTVSKALDPHSEGFYQEAYQQFAELLTEEELRVAKSVTPNAYYTSPRIAQEIWGIVKAFGFTGGNVLEPSCGSGVFMSNCPNDILYKSMFVGVELDPISAQIAELLHQYAIICNQGFETFQLEHGSFDLAIGNVPFGATTLWDRELGIEPQKIHNFFLLKAMKLVRKGGLVAFLTSTGFLDSQSGEAFRKVISRYGELLLATRLPGGTFKENSNTEVTIDLVVFKKHLTKPGDYTSVFSGKKVQYPDWVESYPIQKYRSSEVHKKYINYDHERVTNWGSRLFAGVNHQIDINKGSQEDIYELAINQYFIANLQNLLGMISVDKLYGGGSRGALLPSEGLDPIYELKAIASNIKPQYQAVPLEAITILDPELAKLPNGSFAVLDGNVVQKKTGKLHDGNFVYTEQVKNPEKVLGFVQLANTLMSLIDAQKGDDEDKIHGLREKLNSLYDQWVEQYGYIHKNSDLEDDIRYYLLLALETPENTKGSKKYKKSDIFYKRTAKPATLLEKCDRTQDAVAISINRYGAIDVDYMASLMGQDKDWICQDLKANKLAYFNPVTEQWELPETYLSGNIRKKLDQAIEAGLFENIKALEAVLPKWLLPDADLDICVKTAVEIGVDNFREDQAKFDISISQTWVDVEIYRQFMFWLFQLRPTDDAYIKYFRYPSNEFKIISKPFVPKDSQYGTVSVNAIDLLEMALNGMKPKVMKTIETVKGKKTIEDKNRTLAAIAAQDKIKAAFQKWVFTDLERAVHLTKKYNIDYNAYVSPVFNGQYLTFPGINPVIELRNHQKDAAWRGLNQKSFLLGWEVGGGKTIGFIVAAMEQKRLGLISKPMFVVLNSTISDIETEFRKLYPTAKLLVGEEKSTSPQNRWKFLYKIAVGDWDAIIITHSQFKAISMSSQARIEFIQSELKMIEEQNEEAKSLGATGRKSLKSRASITEFYKKKLELAMDQLDNSQDNIDWELLGVDALIIDEFHQYKNLYRNTKKDEIAGMPNSAAERAFDCYMKLRHVITNGGRVILATGTPVSNTLAEAWTMLRYLNLEYLEEMGLQHFDSFFELFFEATTEFEILPYGYKLRERVREIKNHPELVEILGQFMDVRDANDLDLPRPSHEVISVGCPSSPEQMDYLQELCDRYAAFMSRAVDPRIDNPLKIIGDGRASQLDARLRIADAGNLISSKVNQCIRNVYRIWELTTPVSGVQAIFCDFSIPKKHIFNVYQYVKDVLVALGIPENQIAFVQDCKTKAQKKFLLHLCNTGEIRVVLGSTSKLGTGVNIQKRLFALHHLDAPWRPSDIAQREGRVVRQGNLFDHVLIFRYVTQGGDDGKIPGFDAFIWGVIESKAKVFTGLFKSNNGQRRLETDDSVVMNMSMLKAIATGDDGFLKLEKINQEVKKAEILKDEWRFQAYYVRSRHSEALRNIEVNRGQIDTIQDDLTYLKENPFRKLPITIDGDKFSFKEGIKKLEKTPSGILKSKNIWIGKFRITVQDGYETEFEFYPSKVSIKTKKWLQNDEFDFATKLVNITNELVASIDRYEAQIPDLEERMKRFETYPNQKELDDLIAQQKVLQEKYGEKSAIQDGDNDEERIKQGVMQKHLNEQEKQMMNQILDLKHYLKLENPTFIINGEHYSIEEGWEVISQLKEITAKDKFEVAGFSLWIIPGLGISLSREARYSFESFAALIDAIANFDEYLKDQINELTGQLIDQGVIKELPDLDNLGDEEETDGKEKVYEFWHKDQIQVAYSGVDADFIESMKSAIADEELPVWVETTRKQVQIVLNKIDKTPEPLPGFATITVEPISEEIVDDDEEELDFSEYWDYLPSQDASIEEIDDEEEFDWGDGWELVF